MTLTLSNALVALECTTPRGVSWTFTPYNIAINGGRIEELTPAKLGRGHEHIDAADCVILPAFVNAHTHGFELALKGLKDGRGVDDPHPDWFWKVYNTIPTELLHLGFRLHLLECINAGIASVVEVVRSDLPTEPFAEILQNVGLSGLVFGAHDTHCGFDLGFESHAQFPRRLEQAMQLSPSCPLHIHFLETQRRRRAVFDHFGCTTGRLLAERGLLDHPILATHCGTAGLEDLTPLSGSNTLLVATPIAETRLGEAHLDLRLATQLDLPVALGTDGPCYNPRTDMFAEMREMNSWKTRRGECTSTGDLLYAATLAARPWLGAPGTGIAIGETADLTILSLNRIGLQPCRTGFFPNVLSLLLGAAKTSDLLATIVRGRVLMLDGELRVPGVQQLAKVFATEVDAFLRHCMLENKYASAV